MSDEKLIFPKNWDLKRKKQQGWKKPEVQENICPNCHRYGGRFKHDSCCQFCGYEVKEEKSEEEITLKQILKTIIGRAWGFETCGGNWFPECEDSTAPECRMCCRGKKVLEDLEKVKESK
jgi:hypothetical protein